MSLRDTTPPMWWLARDIERRLPEKIRLILRLAAHMPLEEALTMPFVTLGDPATATNGMVLHGTLADPEDGILPFWLPEDLSRELWTYYGERRRKYKYEKCSAAARAHIKSGVNLRYFYRGNGIPITVDDVFAVIARAVRTLPSPRLDAQPLDEPRNGRFE